MRRSGTSQLWRSPRCGAFESVTRRILTLALLAIAVTPRGALARPWSGGIAVANRIDEYIAGLSRFSAIPSVATNAPDVRAAVAFAADAFARLQSEHRRGRWCRRRPKRGFASV
jgi:hypothetical protein